MEMLISLTIGRSNLTIRNFGERADYGERGLVKPGDIMMDPG